MGNCFVKHEQEPHEPEPEPEPEPQREPEPEPEPEPEYEVRESHEPQYEVREHEPPLDEHEREPDHVTNMSELPKKYIKLILSFTTPRDVCRLAAVSTLFRSAANSDSVWNKFIPQQCEQMLSKAVSPIVFSSKKDLYFCLCDSILIEEKTKRFWLDRSTAKIGYMLSARELFITWGDDQRYWRWVNLEDSRFGELAELLDVCWLEARGGMDCRLLSQNTEYRVVFVLKFGESSYGWEGQLIQFSVTTPEGDVIESAHCLEEMTEISNDGWMEVVAGEFKVKAAEHIDEESSYVEFCMKEVESNWWKGGLLIDGVRIKPKPI